MKVIQPGEKYKNKIKYILINSDKKICKVILNKDNKEKEVLDKFQDILPNFSVDCKIALTTKEEVEMIWPQLTKEFNEKFSYSKSWFERAKLFFENDKLIISLETKLAAKKMNNPKVVNFIKNRIYYYLDRELNIEIKNGDFFKNDESLKKELEEQLKKKDKKRKKKRSRKNKIVYGRKIKNTKNNIEIDNINSEQKNVVTSGILFDQEVKQIKKNLTLHTFHITNYKDSITCKAFLRNQKQLNLKEDMKVLVRGEVQYDRYSKDLILMSNDINKLGEKEKRKDKADEKRIELHLHTKMSAMDSTVEVEDAVKQAADWGHDAIAITDHGVVQAYPDAYQAGQEHGVDIIFGLEAYLIDNGKPIVENPIKDQIEDTEFVVFDLETTGLNPVQNEIIEIGAVKIKSGEIVDEFSSLVKPDQKISDKITEITGIDNNMVKDAPSFEKVFSSFVEFIGDCPLVAHNMDFDYSFIRKPLNEFKNNNEVTLVDTLTLARAVLPELKNHKLATLVNYYDIKLDNHHRALDDSKATAFLFNELLNEEHDLEIKTVKNINDLTKNIDWKKSRPYHAIVLAKNQEGLKEIYKLVSESHLNNFYRKPRILKSDLIANRENLLIGTACESGQLFKYILNDRSTKEINEIVEFYDFLEIQPLGNNEFLIPNQVEDREELKKINKKIYNLGKTHNKPVVGTGDVHFFAPKDKIYRKVLQAGQGFDDYDNQAPLYLRTTDEMLEEFDYFNDKEAREIVIENTNKIYNMIEEIQPIPDGLYTPEIEGADEKIKEMSYSKAQKLYGENLPQEIEKRLEKELNSIIDNGYSVIYLIAHKLVKRSLEDGYLVGSRGSVGSSFVATMCDITEVNPLPPHYRCENCKNVELINNDEVSTGVDLADKKCPECGHQYKKDGFDIPFEVFMGFEGDKVPDIDLNFSGEYQNKIHEVTEEFFGRDYVFRAGTISTIASRTAFGFVRNYLDDNEINVKKAEVNRLVDGCTGIKRTTGQHPGGLMVVPKNMDIYDFSPIQHPANDQDTRVRTTHFDYHSISGRILKLDLLGHDDPTSLRMLQDLTGVDPETIPLDDPETMKIFSSTESIDVSKKDIQSEVGTYGIPEFGTSFVRQMLIETRPSTFAELVRISGLSHGTDVWLNNARELIKDNIANLSEVISVRDDIMNFLLQKGMEPIDAFWIMEHVRKGKGLTKEEESKMRQNNIPEWYIESCKKIKYMFPKAHAAAYVMMAYRIAYFKVHYPKAFYLTYFSTKASAFDAQIVDKGLDFVNDHLNKLNNQDKLTAKDKETITILEVVIEAMHRGIEFGKVDLYNSKMSTFILSDDKLIPPLICLEGLGTSAAESIIEARKDGEFISVEDLSNRTRLSKTVIEKMKDHGTLKGLPEKNQLSLFTSS
ncbi:MAG: PolC-type DNA polymerase III [Halanaerobiales bacterium]|nr:PolC-type DNA polymerase III [Halanaerobiales bacterium]